jgi:hypothetical protein
MVAQRIKKFLIIINLKIDYHVPKDQNLYPFQWYLFKFIYFYFFIYGLCNDSFTNYNIWRRMDRWKMSDDLERIWKETVTTWTILYSRIWLEGLRKITKTSG